MFKRKKRVVPHRKRPALDGNCGSCRKLLRSIAHANMRKGGIQNPNRKVGRGQSMFARYWRDFLTV